MRLTPLLPLIALLGLTACDSAKVAELTGVKPAAPAASANCTPNPLPACAPAPGAAPAAMTPEADKAPATGGAAATGGGVDASTVARDDHFAAASTGEAKVNTAYVAAARRHAYTERSIRRTHVTKARRVIVVRKNYYIHDTKYVTVDRPVYQPSRPTYVPPPPMVYSQQRPVEVYVDREIDRTSSAYGRQVYNRYERTPAPPVVYHGLYRQDQRVYSGAQGYAYQSGGYAYQSGGAYRQGYQGQGYQGQGYQGQGYDCRCGSAPAAGRDRSGYLTWPGKSPYR